MQSTDYEKVELYVSCRNLKNMDLFSKSDPQVKLYVLNNGKWNLIGATEVINDNLNPNFTRPFILDFVFEVQQHIKFEVIDIDGTTSFDYIGSIETTLGKIMGAKKQSLLETLHDTHGKAVGKIIVRGEKQSTSQNLICWQWSALKLMNTDGWFDKSDPFLKFFKRRDDGEWLQVHESEVIMDNLNPIWKTFEIKDDKLCGADHSKPIRVECWDWESNGKNQYIGDCQFTLDMLKNKQTEFELSNPKKKKKTGTLKLRTFSVIERPSFLEYIRGGEQLNIITAIDFTGSNGHPSRPESLHARNLNGQMNQYQKALTSVCQILLNYDYDQQIPVFGFGGKPHYPGMSSTVVAHCFPCSGNLNQTEVQGMDGILAVYDYALNNVELSGPTFFAPIIGEAMKLAQVHKQQETGVYTVLLILTDGEIHDMDQTIDAICAASHLPISIIIVGVGNADFGKMEILDGDQGLYSSRGQKAQRDLVQFVPFRNFNGDMVQLAQHVLAEVPDQLVEYMRLVGRKPRPPVMVDVNKLGFSSLATMGEQPQAVGQPGVPYGGGNAQAQPLAQNAYLMNAGMHNLVQSVTNNVMGGGFGAPVDPYTNYGGAGHQQQQQPQLAQNPYLMGAGMHDLVHAAVNNGTPVNQYGQPNVQLHSFETNMNHQQQQQQQQQQQPTWMGQQGAVNLQSFGMTQSVNMNQQQMGYQNQQNTPTNQNLYPRYQI